MVATHCGHGTTMRALAHGRPMLCLPMGRDQNDNNAARVAARGAGLRLHPFASVEELGAALARLVSEPEFADNAQKLGRAIADAEFAERAHRRLRGVRRDTGKPLGLTSSLDLGEARQRIWRFRATGRFRACDFVAAFVYRADAFLRQKNRP